MGKGSSGMVKILVQNLIGNKQPPAPAVKPINALPFTSLGVAENIIRDKRIENMIVFENTSQPAISAYSGNAHAVSIPAGNYSGKTLTHNHPNRNWGGTLSRQDIRLLSSTNAKSLRAVGRRGEGGYIITQSRNSNVKGFANRVAKDYNMLESKMIQAGNSAAQRGLSSRGIRQATVGVLHSYYKQTASQYGLTYTRNK